MASFYAFVLLIAASVVGLFTPDRGWVSAVLLVASVLFCVLAILGVLP